MFAVHSIFIENDIDKAKLFFSNSASASEYMSIKYDRRIMDTGIEEMSYALLSDNVSLINRYALLKNKVNNVNFIGFQMPNAMQNILLNDFDKLDVNIDSIQKQIKYRRYRWYEPIVDVFQGFKTKDEALIKSGLLGLLKTHNKRNKSELICKFLSTDTAGLCKLAWRCGYEIDLGSPLVPIELMPIRPLTEYQTYNFLI
ncbi:hypothetical protein D3C72_856210 [compost metagenome]